MGKNMDFSKALVVKLYIFDINKLKDDFLNLPYITEEDKLNALKCKNIINQKQQIISSYFKRKYIKYYYYNEYKKPISKNIYFNISHSDNYVIMALNDKYDIGVDIENKNRIIKDKFINNVSNDEELKIDKEEFFKIWTSKESLLKCVGTGIVNNLKEVNGVPFYGLKEYKDNKFFSKDIEYNDEYYISVTIKNDSDYIIKIIEEEVEYNV